MQKVVRALFQRYYALMNAIPAPQMGGYTASASMSGFVSYAQDMIQFQPAMQRALLAILLTEMHAPPDTIDDDPAYVLTCIEAWIAQRKAVDWKAPVVPLDLNARP